MSYNAINKYQQNTVLSATPEELTLMLYNGAIKFMNIGRLGIEENNINKKHEGLVKSQSIIGELKATLDMSIPLSKELDGLYDFILDRLMDANIKKDIEALDEAILVTTDLKDTWKEAMNQYKKTIYQAK